ncbi:MAG TPA: rhomboid family intramembrane serine protease [Solirubrobacteraceae bacterium]|nr:rhomboid family intramembrane serine protease [Solirubrobacteraceae bacterium]
MARGAARLREHEEGFYAGAAIVALLLGAMWIVQIVNSLDGQDLDGDGIISRRLGGLPGILSAPFLHASYSHLLANSVPFAILGLIIALGGAAQVIAVTVIAAIVSGLGAWALSSSGTDTIGASGVVFGYAAFLIARGAFTRSLAHLGLGVLVVVLFGGALLLSVLPQSGVSWQDHVFGAVGGVGAARALSRRPSGGSSSPADPQNE